MIPNKGYQKREKWQDERCVDEIEIRNVMAIKALVLEQEERKRIYILYIEYIEPKIRRMLKIWLMVQLLKEKKNTKFLLESKEMMTKNYGTVYIKDKDRIRGNKWKMEKLFIRNVK